MLFSLRVPGVYHRVSSIKGPFFTFFSAKFVSAYLDLRFEYSNSTKPDFLSDENRGELVFNTRK